MTSRPREKSGKQTIHSSLKTILEVNLTKEVKHLGNENFKTLKKVSEKASMLIDR